MPFITNSLTMTTILLLAPFFLAISPVDAAKTDCDWVIESWRKMGKTTYAIPQSNAACCTYIVSNGETVNQTTGIPGVTCTTSGITVINWQSQGLQGPIPSTIPNLKNLVELNLGYNSLTDFENLFNGAMPKLKYLNLDINPLVDKIPKGFLKKFPSLQELYLDENPGVTGCIKSSKLSHWWPSRIVCGNHSKAQSRPKPPATGLKSLKTHDRVL